MGQLQHDGHERRTLESGQPAAALSVGPFPIRVYEFRRKNRITVVLHGATLAADVGSVLVEATLARDEGDEPIWYPLETKAIPDAATVALLIDSVVVGSAVRLSITFARVSLSDVVVEVAQS